MSKCIVKILRDETPGGLAEKINKELEENTRSWDTVTGIKYQIPGGSNSDYERKRNSRV